MKVYGVEYYFMGWSIISWGGVLIHGVEYYFMGWSIT
jgi:hypothetical protein